MTSGTHALILAQSAFEAVCKERDEALALLASEKSTRNAIIAKGVEMERQLETMRELHNKNAATHNELRELCSSLRADRDEARQQLEAVREAIKEAHMALLRVSECKIFYAESMDIDNYTQEDCDNALAKLQPFLKP